MLFTLAEWGRFVVVYSEAWISAGMPKASMRVCECVHARGGPHALALRRVALFAQVFLLERQLGSLVGGAWGWGGGQEVRGRKET